MIKNLSYMDLLKQIKLGGQKSMGKTVRIAILADSASQHLKTVLKGCGVMEGYDFEIFDADYNQIDFQIYDGQSELYHWKPDYVILFMCVQKLYEQYCTYENKSQFAEDIIQAIEAYHQTIRQQLTDAGIIQFLFLEEDDRIFGNFALGLENSFIYQVKKINFGLMRMAVQDKVISLLDLNYIRTMAGGRFLDETQYCTSKLAISLDALPFVAQEVLTVIKAKQGKVKKCVILDLDNTLWGGVIGDDGLEGIELGELGIGHAFCEFQLWLKELKKRGILLCICSKNNEETAREPFEKHADMILHLEDIAMFVASWDDKASNIKYIQETLNIGMDSIVFVDDNPFERDIVKSMIPDITVPDMPEDPALYVSYLRGLNLFETASYSANDAERTKQYQEEAKRNVLRKSISDISEYLKDLEMISVVRPFEPYYYPRIAQLTQRSNQFNLRTVRYSESEIAHMAQDDRYMTLYFTLQDRFGDYGLVGVVIMEKRGRTAFIDTWLMSCRVLKRGMEEFIANSIMRCAVEYGMEKVVGEYIQTPKNAMVEHLYENLGFKAIGNSQYEMAVNDYREKENFIIRKGDNER